MTQQQTQARTVAFLVAAEGVEQVELTGPWQAVEEAGATPRLLSPETGQVQAFDHLDKADTFEVDEAVGDADPAAYDALVLPGGVANPDALRTDKTAMDFVRAFVESGKPVAAICHAPWSLVEAGVLPGRTLTSWPSLQTDIRNWWHVGRRGGRRRRQPVTSRRPDDIPAFNAKLVELLGAG
jgi:protease I